MASQGSRSAARVVLVLGCATLAAAQAATYARLEPVATWSYDLSWWSAIAIANGAVHLRTGASPALSRPRAFLLLAAWSAAYWLLHEAANLRLSNWYYVGIPDDVWTRTAGVIVSFATVLPGVLGIAALLATTRLFRGARSRPFPLGPRTLAALRVAGLACAVLPLAFPREAYPLIWGAVVLLVEPWLAARGEDGLLARLAAGDPRPALIACASGAVCGAMWEWWNAASPAKWIYTVPFLEERKLFEMPWLGFVGFIPFALSCESAGRALVAARLLPEWDPSRPPRPAPSRTRAGVALAAALAFSALATAGLNRWTVRGTTAYVRQIPGLPAAIADRLESQGLARPEELVAAAERGGLAADVQPSWVEAARLMLVRGLAARGLAWLAGAGVATVEQLARADPEDLHRRMIAARAGPPPEPTPAEVRVWVRGARAR